LSIFENVVVVHALIDILEQFENDESMSSSVLKTLKRSMAAEYSRELSVKVAKAERTKEGLLLITSVMRQLIRDDNFLTLLRAKRSRRRRAGK
jgi:hypothetical protein